MHRKASLIFLLLLVGLPACIDAAQTITVNQSGGAVVTQEISAPKYLVASNQRDLLAQYATQLQTKWPQATIQSISDPIYTGLIIRIPFKSQDEALGSLAEGPDHFFLVATRLTDASLLGKTDTYVFITTEPTVNDTLGYWARFVTYHFTLQIPSRISQAPGGKISGDRHSVEWGVDLSHQNDLSATTEPYGGLGIPWWLPLLIVPATIVVGYWVGIKRK